MTEPAAVTIAPPDVTVEGSSQRRLNLYLYQISENGSLKNQDIPGIGHPGAYGHPPLSLDLYYLLTAYAANEAVATADLEAQQVLGDAMRVLHDFPVVTRSLAITKSTVSTAGEPVLDPGLLGAFEQVKITLQPATLEDFSKIWTALPEANFRRSVAYMVSVVQIESQRSRRFPRPVGEPPSAGPRVQVVPFRSPQIRDIHVIRQDDADRRERPFPYARIGDTLVLRGRNFASETTRVILGTVDMTAQVVALQDDRIEVTIRDDTALQPGPQPVKVVLDVLMGEPPALRTGFQSNLAVFVLVPHIKELDSTATPGALSIRGTRLFHADLESLFLVGDHVIRPDDDTTTRPTEWVFTLPTGLGSGNFAVRVRVNGMESLDEAILSIP